eukprot:CAMPEP_0204013194 /NCGR_PEP_ID=MMETSP0360-20130528/24529_1 /ASSEMBLY_ACC=CAM_ASM_000342 /TAXON_ID=268821 /ORGANISM="Scrippsiella Hangoei, Strain SHTV-5" /LENGTH=41 /DNA_ID= /DNA_START= /DNA_END= /DNA_ORIENTATION=
MMGSCEGSRGSRSYFASKSSTCTALRVSSDFTGALQASGKA